jgi:5'-nucleotidase
MLDSNGSFSRMSAFGEDIFFDDQKVHCHFVKAHVATGHVPHGVVNE